MLHEHKPGRQEEDKSKRWTFLHHEAQCSAGPRLSTGNEPADQHTSPPQTQPSSEAQHSQALKAAGLRSSPYLPFPAHMTLGELWAPRGPDSTFVKQGCWSTGVPPPQGDREDEMMCLKQLAQNLTACAARAITHY